MNKVGVKNSIWWSILRGAMISVSISLALILAFALLIKFFNISQSLILPINQAIKIISIFMGTLFAFGKIKEKGFLKGMLIGLIYTILAYSVFSILAGEFSFTLTSFTDMIFGAIIGGISGIIVVNLKKWENATN